jgi:prepilin signal peptidase PulO-like enzyme (type II secretory pathway)
MGIFYGAYVFVFGSLIGSFLNVVIIRLPQRRDIVAARSACMSCRAQLRWYHNLPLLSFLVLRGKCGFCGARISWRYPLVELLTGLVALALVPAEPTLPSLATFLFYFAIACVFICHFLIDLDHHLLLDSLNLYLLVLFLVYGVFTFDWSYWLVGGAVGFGAPFFVTWLFYKLRGQIGLGGGDIKLYGILGLYLGPVGVLLTIFLSCFLGALVGLSLIGAGRMTRDKPMAFGPAIILVAAFQIYFPEIAYAVQKFLFI